MKCLNRAQENFVFNTTKKQNIFETNPMTHLVQNNIYNRTHSNIVNALLICAPY
jgi:hypothetical protein